MDMDPYLSKLNTDGKIILCLDGFIPTTPMRPVAKSQNAAGMGTEAFMIVPPPNRVSPAITR